MHVIIREFNSTLKLLDSVLLYLIGIVLHRTKNVYHGALKLQRLATLHNALP